MMKKKIFLTMALTICMTAALPCGAGNMGSAQNEAVCVAEAATKKTFKLSDAQYKKVKGWWTSSSSGGWDVKFTRTKVKYYDRETGKVAWTATIKNCKKKNGLYVYYIKSENGTYEYRLTEDGKGLEYYWKDKQSGEYSYSGSSSLNQGKW